MFRTAFRRGAGVAANSNCSPSAAASSQRCNNQQLPNTNSNSNSNRAPIFPGPQLQQLQQQLEPLQPFVRQPGVDDLPQDLAQVQEELQLLWSCANSTTTSPFAGLTAQELTCQPPPAVSLHTTSVFAAVDPAMLLSAQQPPLQPRLHAPVLLPGYQLHSSNNHSSLLFAPVAAPKEEDAELVLFPGLDSASAGPAAAAAEPLNYNVAEAMEAAAAVAVAAAAAAGRQQRKQQGHHAWGGGAAAGGGVSKPKHLHSSTRQRNLLHSLQERMEVLSQQVAAEAALNSLLHQRWAQVSTDYDSLTAAAVTASDSDTQQQQLQQQMLGEQLGVTPALDDDDSAAASLDALTASVHSRWTDRLSQLVELMPHLEPVLGAGSNYNSSSSRSPTPAGRQQQQRLTEPPAAATWPLLSPFEAAAAAMLEVPSPPPPASTGAAAVRNNSLNGPAAPQCTPSSSSSSQGGGSVPPSTDSRSGASSPSSDPQQQQHNHHHGIKRSHTALESAVKQLSLLMSGALSLQQQQQQQQQPPAAKHARLLLGGGSCGGGGGVSGGLSMELSDSDLRALLSLASGSAQQQQQLSQSELRVLLSSLPSFQQQQQGVAGVPASTDDSLMLTDSDMCLLLSVLSSAPQQQDEQQQQQQHRQQQGASSPSRAPNVAAAAAATAAAAASAAQASAEVLLDSLWGMFEQVGLCGPNLLLNCFGPRTAVCDCCCTRAPANGLTALLLGGDSCAGAGAGAGVGATAAAAAEAGPVLAVYASPTHWDRVRDCLQLTPQQTCALQQLLAGLQAAHETCARQRAQLLQLLRQHFTSTQGWQGAPAYPSCYAAAAAAAVTEQLAGGVGGSIEEDCGVLLEGCGRLWGPQSPLSLVQRVKLLVASYPFVPSYSLLEYLVVEHNGSGNNGENACMNM